MEPKITHHLPAELLMAYSAGALPEAYSLVIATHISMCDACRAELESYDTVGGALLEDCQNVAMDQGALDATMARIAALDSAASHTATGPAPAPRAAGNSILPAPLADYVGGDVDAIRWRPVGGGVKQAVLDTADDASARLLYIPAGMAVPDHGHRGLELTLVLQGAFSDEDGRFGRGDIEVANQEVAHTPIAEEGAPCICLAATDAPLRFTGFIPRLAQPFLGI